MEQQADYHLTPTLVDIPDELLHAQSVGWEAANLPGPLSDQRGAADEGPSSSPTAAFPKSQAV